MKLDDEVIARKTKLFKDLVEPNLNMVYKLCLQYSRCNDYVQDNYTEVLANFFKYIESYDGKRSVLTWIHIVTKRYVFNADAKRDKNLEYSLDTSMQILDNGPNECNFVTPDNYEQYYSDDILNAINSLAPVYKRTLMLQMAGYKLNEIVDITHEEGLLKTKNIETVKSRLFLARSHLKSLLNRDGTSKIKMQG
jgi:RNA polymerase sigma factor (sigma-70 family)